MNTVQTHPLVREYLRQLEAAAGALPSGERSDLLAGVREHIDQSLHGLAVQDEVAIRNALERLGEPREIVAAAAVGDAGAELGPAEPPVNAGVAPLVWGIVGLTILPVIGSIVAVIKAGRVRRGAAALGIAPPTAAVAGQVLGWVGLAGPILIALTLYFTFVPRLAFGALDSNSAFTFFGLAAAAGALPFAGSVALVVTGRQRQRRALLTGRRDPSARGVLGWVGVVVLAVGAGFGMLPFVVFGGLVELGLATSSPRSLALGLLAMLALLAVPGAVAVLWGRHRRRAALEQEAPEPAGASTVEVLGWFVLAMAAAALPVVALLGVAGLGPGPTP